MVMSVRETMLMAAIEKAASPKLEDVAALLPGDFDLSQDELDAIERPATDVEASLADLDAELLQLRAEARTRRNDLVAARTALANANGQWTRNGHTAESVTREWISSNQAERQRIADSQAGLTQQSNSNLCHVDYQSRARTGHSADVGYGQRAGGFRRVPPNAAPGTHLSPNATYKTK
jgi:hypothetical protein